MAIRKVARMGHPVLRKKARELSKKEISSAEIQNLIQDMAETMRDYGGLGIAAPQIHESLRISLIDFSLAADREEGSEEAKSPQGLKVFINPVLTVLDPTPQSFWEGCLSVPGLRGLVSRPRKVRVQYLDEKAQSREIEAEGFLATVFQHEFDHLDGVLYVDRIEDRTKFSFNEEFESFLLSEETDSNVVD